MNTPDIDLRTAVPLEDRIAAYLGEADGEIPLLLHEAVMHCDLQVLEYLLSIGADINETNELGNTALHLAMSFLNVDACRFLICNKANLYIKNKNGDTIKDLIHRRSPFSKGSKLDIDEKRNLELILQIPIGDNTTIKDIKYTAKARLKPYIP